jgi:hypothetical protein
MEKTRIILGAGAAVGVIALVFLGLMDPTRGDIHRLDALTEAVRAGPRLDALSQKASYTADLDSLVQRPVFAMTTGSGAYAEKTFQLFGVSISAARKAVLVAIDGAPPVWVRTGEISGDVQLIDVNGGSARFDTPLGERSVNMSDPPPAVSPNATTGG